MQKLLVVLIIAAAFLAGCKKSSGAGAGTSAKAGTPVQQKLQELAGGGATDCGYLKTMAPDQLTPAGTCALQAAQKKQAFYVAYEMPGMTVAVAGNSDGKLYSVSTQQPEGGAQAGAAPEAKTEPCPSELRLAQSGRVTCFPPGSFGSMGANPHGGSGMGMPPAGTANPHGTGMSTPPAGAPNPHAGKSTPPKQ
jgi:hypothetical protein